MPRRQTAVEQPDQPVEKTLTIVAPYITGPAEQQAAEIERDKVIAQMRERERIEKLAAAASEQPVETVEQPVEIKPALDQQWTPVPQSFVNDSEMRARLFRKLLRVMADAPAAAQTGENKNINKKYADVDDIAKVVMPLMYREGVMLTWYPDAAIERFDTGSKTGKGEPFELTRMWFVFTLTDVETGYQMVTPWVAEAVDHMRDKGIPKCLTIARRTYLLHQFHVISGEEKTLWSQTPDTAPPQVDSRQTRDNQQRQQQDQRRQPDQQRPGPAQRAVIPGMPAPAPAPEPEQPAPALEPLAGYARLVQAMPDGRIAIKVETGFEDDAEIYMTVIVKPPMTTGIDQSIEGSMLTMTGYHVTTSSGKQAFVPETLDIEHPERPAIDES